MSVWDDLVGQERVVETLRAAAADAAGVLAGQPASAMTHAWLITGPPGSGRSTAARAFTAALQCLDGGCGECTACRTVRSGSHADLEVVSTEALTISVKDARELVLRASRHPAGGRWQVVIVEDADRLTEQAANALLKAVEEPAARTVWLLCAPSPEDVLPTIRSRCRHVLLRTPPVAAVAAFLTARDGVDPAMAAFAARAVGGPIGRARRLAQDESARLRRAEVLRVPTIVTGVAQAVAAAAALVEAATEEAAATTAELDVREAEALGRALGEGTTGRAMSGSARAALKDLEKAQKQRATRVKRDALDRALTDLVTFYRDVLAVQVGADDVGLTNAELRPQIDRVAATSTPEVTLGRMEAILAAREAVEANVAPLLAVEAMALRLRQP
ncbi:MAG TPA: DNA polymerase III subunit delta' [Actinomycetes bacterium]|nr:DNA polymerase III subunit delta' [Actinomycetes bacterium]